MEEGRLIHWGKIKEFYKKNVNKGSGCQRPNCLGALNLGCWLFCKLFSSDTGMPCYHQKHTFKWLKQTFYLSVCASCCVGGITAFSSRLLQTADYRNTASQSFYTRCRKQVAIFLVLSASLKKEITARLNCRNLSENLQLLSFFHSRQKCVVFLGKER